MRIAITGMGVVTSIGTGVPAFTEALRNVKQSLSKLTHVPTPRGKSSLGLVDDAAFDGPDRAYRMAKNALTQALTQAQTKLLGKDSALILSTLTADSKALEDIYGDFSTQDVPSAQILEALRLYPNGALLHALGNEFGLLGPRFIVSNACASGNLSMGLALDMMRLGQCRSAVLVGVELVKLSTLWGAERAAFIGRNLRPFHTQRDGSILGEGAGAIVFQRAEDVPREQILGWLEGFGCGVDLGAAGNSLIEDGSGLRRAMQYAIEDAGRQCPEIDYVNAHAPGTRPIDLTECKAIADLLGEHASQVAVNSTKGLTSHMSAASGIVEAVSVVVQMNAGFVHGNANLDEPDPSLACPVMGMHTATIDVAKALSNGCGGGGLNTSVLLTRSDIEEPAGNHPPLVSGAVAITGIGTVSVLGAGDVGVLRRGDTSISSGGALRWFDIDNWFPSKMNYRYMSRAGQLAACSGRFAIEDARIQTAYAPDRVAVISGTLFGGSPESADLLCGTLHRDPNALLPSMALDHGIHLGSSLIRRYYNYNGITYTVTGSPLSGLNAVNQGVNLLACGRADAAIVVGHDAFDAPLQKLAGWFPDSELARNMSEGAGTVVLETLESAQSRGISPWCVIEEQITFTANLETEELRHRAADHLLGSFRDHDWEILFVAGTAIRELLDLSNILIARSGLKATVHCLHEKTGYCMSADPMLALCAAAATGKRALVLAAENQGALTTLSISGGTRSEAYLEQNGAFLQETLMTSPPLVAPSWTHLYHALSRAPDDLSGPARKIALKRSLVSHAATEPFPWRMKDGFVLFISPLEGAVSYETVGWSCFQDREWEPHVESCLRYLLHPRSLCIDVGANLGYLTFVMAQCVPQGQVYAFEPMASTFNRLKSGIDANGFANVRAFPLALGSIDGRAKLFVHESATGNASLHKDPIARLAHPEEVVVRSLDSLFAEGVISLPDVIKIDVEGHEMEILRGARRLIKESGAAILFEFNERMSRLASWNANELAQLLLSLGDYELYQLSEKYLIPVDMEKMTVVRNTHIDMLAWNRKRGDLSCSGLTVGTDVNQPATALFSQEHSLSN